MVRCQPTLDLSACLKMTFNNHLTPLCNPTPRVLNSYYKNKALLTKSQLNACRSRSTYCRFIHRGSQLQNNTIPFLYKKDNKRYFNSISIVDMFVKSEQENNNQMGNSQEDGNNAASSMCPGTKRNGSNLDSQSLICDQSILAPNSHPLDKSLGCEGHLVHSQLNNSSNDAHEQKDLNQNKHASPATSSHHTSSELSSPSFSSSTSSSKQKIGIDTKDSQDKDRLRSRHDDDCITIIHFNDCYNIEPGPKSSGAAGFLTAVNEHKHLNPMILFSGDVLSPSFMSTFTKGEQMIPVLNDIGVHCAVFGNHEFDYGVDNLMEFVKRTTFPWLLSNVIDKETSNQLGDGLVFHILERSGLKFGLIGLIEEEWLSTLSTLDSSDVIYEDFVTRGQSLAKWLKSDPHNVDYVIALTHFRTPNDIRLADAVPEIDLILGGHDHDYEVIKRPNSYIIKSGTDFREFSKITLKINPDYLHYKQKRNSDCQGGTPVKKVDDLKPFICSPEIEHIKCIGYQPDEKLKNKLDKFVTTIDEKMVKVLGQFNCDLDGRFSSIRKFETNLGNFVTDIMLASTHADLAILNSGTLRSDRIHPKGDFTMRDLFNILGYIDPIAVLEASGKQIWRALENGVSQWPKLEGRFPQVGGCSFKFDPNKPQLQRIDPKDITIGDEPLVLDKKYRLTTKAYLASGKDGYDALKECQILVPGDESPDLTTSILNHFEAINIVKSNRRTHHRQSIICLSRTSLQKMLHQTTPNLQIHAKNHHNQETSLHDHQPQSASLQLQQDLNSDLASQSDTSNELFEVQSRPTQQQQRNDNDDNNNANLEHTEAELSDTFGDELVSPTATANNNCLRANSPVTTPLVTLRSTGSELEAPASAIQQPNQRTKRIMSVYEMEHEQCKLEPKVEGRIRIVGINA